MSKQIFNYSVGAASLLLSMGLAAKTVYVAPDGNNNNDGSEAAPFASFWKANSVLAAGDTLIIAGGEYRQTLTINKSGTAAEPILVRAKDGERVVIKGTEPVTGWTPYADGIYSTQVNMTIVEHSRQVYHNDELMQIARWPNDSDNDIFTIDAHEVTEAGTESSLTVAGIPDVDLTDGYLWYLGQHSGTSWTKQITSNTLTEINYPAVDITKWPYSNHNPVKRYDGGFGRFFVYGKLDLLDHDREWHYDAASQTLYFKPADGQQPADGDVEIAVRERAIEIDGSYVDLEGINVWGANVKLDGHFNRYAKAEVLHGKQRLGNPDAASGATIGDASINVIGRNNTIEDNVILHGSISGIQIAGWGQSGDNAVIQRNEIRYFDTLGNHTSPIRSNADNVKILKNTISHTGRDAMYVVGTGSEIAYNDVSYAAMINNDGGLFYTVGNTENRNIEIHHNWWHDAMRRDYHDHRTAGIYLDNDSKGFLVHHNVVWNVPWSGVQLNWDNWDNHIYHNTFIDVEQAMGEWINGRNPRDNRVWNNFSTHADWIRSDAYDLDSNLIIEGINQLVDPANQNFMPNAASSLLDSGRDIDDLVVPFAGPAPDVGAYEAGGTRWTAGINAIEDTCDNCASDPNAAPVHPPINPSVMFDDRSKYLSTEYVVGGQINATVNFDAGTGNTVTDTLGGVRFFLRTVDKSTGAWQVVSDIRIDDASAIGKRAGAATATIPLTGLPATVDLPADHFYFLFVQFESSNGVKKAVGAQPLTLVEPAPGSISWDNINNYRNTPFLNTGFMDITVNVEAGTGQEVTSDLSGVKILLRELRSNWTVVSDTEITDASLVGEQSGTVTLSLPLHGLTPTAQLPNGNFYFLFARFKSSDGKVHAATASPIIIDSDFDGDLIGDAMDNDDDNDGILDGLDVFPYDANESVDTDGDGIGNNTDTDDDNDGVADTVDAFPYDASESVDTDGDGIGNNADADDDNDGVDDVLDAFPLDATESIDTDDDGIGNNADNDDDGDSVVDSEDLFPLDASESADFDDDSIGDNADNDDDNDGVEDSADVHLGLVSGNVVITGVDSGITNRVNALGMPLAVQVANADTDCLAGSKNAGQYNSCMSKELNALKAQGDISGSEKGYLQSVVAKNK
ncbi:hypothetical protein C2869_04190 [Saccharobesus litoralis]|uniref:Right handed beta helix domain-containing protein n=1 Tax=Saccharobesus litoralis TaxID=2172099 RepID=A0A2S0VN98_9ALTE|nr:right-handed parallel beta-helix repeat-containing protein [Saccharobesus litoralis]AWB65685.1 hypothetical protein C2869_04190 [Saccharobesus litoralis]